MLTNRRVVVRTGLIPIDERWVGLDRFDTIEIIVRPGQQWYRAGDLVFKLGPIETFHLEGVVRPETFRHTCLSDQLGYGGVRQALAREASGCCSSVAPAWWFRLRQGHIVPC